MKRILVFLGLLLVCGPAVSQDKPNIVLILTDDLGINDLSCHGRKDHATPRIDALAAQGVRFTSAYCALSICSPSRAALMTGKHPARLHLTNYLPGRADAPTQKLRQPVIEGQLPLEEVTVAETLKNAGYATACIGKWHLGGPRFGPEVQGFDVVHAGKANTTPGATEGSKGELDLADRAAEFISAHKDGPFFLYVAHNTPHIPFSATPEEMERHRDAFNPAYAAVMARMDEAVGRVIDAVDRAGVAGRTLFVFTSDNGGLHVPESPNTPATHNTPFRAGKGHLYEGGLRIPLIVRWPGKWPAGTVTDTPVVLTDLVPTFMQAAGIDPAKSTGPLDGVGLASLFAQPAAERTLFWHFPNYTNQGGRPAGAVRRGAWKLIEHFEDGRTELFDLAHDPGETKDVAADNAEKAATLAAELRRWRERIGAQMPEPNPAYDAARAAELYGQQDNSKLQPATTADATRAAWAAWRTAMNRAAEGAKPRITPGQGDIRLHAKDATVHAGNLRYEPEPWKNTLGYWTKVEDWAEWQFDVPAAGRWEVEVLQGSGVGGAEVAVETGGKELVFTVQETGHFQQFIQRSIGQVDLPAGRQTLAVKPRTKPGAAVMDLRRVVLRPVK